MRLARGAKRVSRGAYITKTWYQKNIITQKHALSETSEASLARRVYHKTWYHQKNTSQKHAPSETGEASLARSLYHKNMVSQKHYITKTLCHKNMVSQKHYNITKTWYHKNMRRAKRVSRGAYVTKTWYHKNIIRQERAPSETSEASLARRLYHKSMVSQKHYITNTLYHKTLYLFKNNFGGLRLGIFFGVLNFGWRKICFVY